MAARRVKKVFIVKRRLMGGSPNSKGKFNLLFSVDSGEKRHAVTAAALVAVTWTIVMMAMGVLSC
ncbi:hypothetical protein PAXINDRAFT_21972 [Paxillus involutus ATCC 200175]|uniref:Uncharacterized protein n=1 Tax=Paxillus involutus ATCC 200175 TaxID=664439 RepID=A0A0C9SSN7_PAXIN|nr:hypothetical protein PAXINDRAFT_21972 [Paxillus involutus ATCC 200175]